VGSPRVRVPSFLRCLPYLRSEHSPVGVLDIIPPLRDSSSSLRLLYGSALGIPMGLFVSTGVCAAGIPLGQSRFLQTCGYPQRPFRQPADNGSPLSSGAHKGLSPSRLLAYIIVNQRHPCRAHTRRFMRTGQNVRGYPQVSDLVWFCYIAEWRNAPPHKRQTVIQQYYQ